MFPILFSLGPFTLSTLSLISCLAVLTMAFIFWRKGREEHYSEFELMDCLIQAMAVGLVLGRVGYIIHEFPQLGFSVYKWIDVFSYPGFHGLTAVIVISWKLYTCALKNKWDAFEILDFWSISLAAGLAIMYIGLFLDGSYYGLETALPIGVVFPGLFVKHHPIQLYLSAVFMLLTWYLFKVEYRYRTFEWYRSGKKAAQTGFLISMFTIFASLIQLSMSFFMPNFASFAHVDKVEYAIVIVFGMLLLWKRSGRNFKNT